MIKLLIGQPGIGKTKDIIEQANLTVKSAKGNVIFIGESNESVLELNHNVRYINISEYPLDSSNELIAYLHGLIGGDYDIENIFMDGVLNIYIMTPTEICSWLDKIKSISEKHKINFEISVSINGKTPDCFAPYL